jgi:hypothetical protein
MSCGSAIAAAATDPAIAGAVLLCPLLDGRWRSNNCLRTQPRNSSWVMARAIRDILRPTMIPASAPPGGHGVLTFPGEYEGFKSVVAPGSPWRNAVRASPVLGYSFYRPVTQAFRLRCPVLVQAGARGITVSSEVVEKLVHRAPRAVLKRYDIDHFQSFHSKHAMTLAVDQADWLRHSFRPR